MLNLEKRSNFLPKKSKNEVEFLKRQKVILENEIKRISSDIQKIQERKNDNENEYQANQLC